MRTIALCALLVLCALCAGVSGQASTSVYYSGDGAFKNGAAAPLSAILGVSGKVVAFSIGSGKSVQSCSATTDSSGTATCPITINQALGPLTVSMSFSGDSSYAACSATASVVVFAFPAGGAFIVGDQTAKECANGQITELVFWGNGWWDQNAFSGPFFHGNGFYGWYLGCASAALC